MALISLLTDFGLDDEYVGVMKGVILSINPGAVIVDLTHRIKPQRILQAAFLLQAAFRFFPDKTIHVIVVDPGVGSRRAILACEAQKQFFIAPDNGVLTLLLSESGADRIVRVENPEFFLKPVSHTFHGRDIFAPVAAHLSAGAVLKDLGPTVDSHEVVRLSFPRASVTATGGIAGSVVVIDHFGNLITDIESGMLAQQGISEEKALILMGNATLKGISHHYGSAAPGKPLALVGSRGYLEIAVNSGSAETLFGAEIGSPVRIEKTDAEDAGL